MEKVFGSLRKGTVMKGIILWTKSMVLENTYGEMVGYMKEYLNGGKMSVSIIKYRKIEIER